MANSNIRVRRTLSRARGPAGGATHASSEVIGQHLARLYALVESSPYVFGSPLGPLVLRGESHHLPRFIYFGAQASDDSVRLAFQSGFDGADSRGPRALAHFVARLALTPDVGHGLNLSFFPLVNPSGAEVGSPHNAHGVDLTTENWTNSAQPEIVALRHDAHVRGYHGFVRLESADVDAISAVVRQPASTQMSGLPGLIAEEASDVFPLRWERDHEPVTSGPLTIADDFALQPFELVLRFPRAWSDDVYREAVTQVLRRFIVRYRATLAYGLNL